MLLPSERWGTLLSVQTLLFAQVHGLACATAAAQKISSQVLSEIQLVLALEAQSRAAAILKS
jgi:hypothetical protein